MSLPGGAADKIGNRYEGRWTIHCMLDVMEEKADFIRLEQPGLDAFEFYLQRGDRLEYHQVKRQESTLGHWTLSNLETKDIHVLSNFWKYLQESDTTCMFVSTCSAGKLEELTDRARDSDSFDEFKQEFLKAKKIKGDFDTLYKKWQSCSSNLSDLDVYQALKRIHVQTIGENFLVNILEDRIAAMLEGDPYNIRLDLAELAIREIHQKLTTHDIWCYLQHDRGYRRREYAQDTHVLAVVENITDRYLSQLKDRHQIIPQPIDRQEAEIAFKQLTTTEEKQSILLVGEAGVGKSGVMLQTLEKLQKQGIPILAFRVDRLDPVQHPDRLGENLGLQASPATVLANIARGKDCVLAIDQLDAVSLASGRNTQFFECIHEIIKQTQVHSKMRVLLACRKFDLEHDYRIKQLADTKGIAETIIINRLSPEKVREVVNQFDLDANRLNKKQLELLSIPLHLILLAQIAPNFNKNILGFQTAKDLYDEFWKHKEDIVDERADRPIQWIKIIDLLCEYMSKKQILSAPEKIIREYRKDVKIMASENILVWSDKRIVFFHEGFFDYAFADNFASSDRDLLSFLKSSEQHLFRRAQVRQILLHEREADFEKYISDLEEILNSKDIRFHLKQVILALLGTFSDPTKEEWDILAPKITDYSTPITQHIWRMLWNSNSVGWFKLLDSLGVIENWLNEEIDEELLKRVVNILFHMQEKEPERVVELINPFVGRSQFWFDRLQNFILFYAEDLHRCLFDLFLRLIDIGIYDQKQNQDNNFWSKIYSIKAKKYEWNCEGIAYFINRQIDRSFSSGQPNPFDRQSGTLSSKGMANNVIIDSAENAPLSFLENIVPILLRVLDSIHNNFDKPQLQEQIIFLRYYNGFGMNSLILRGLEISLCSLAKNKPEKFREFIKRLYNSQFETIQFLLIRAYSVNGQEFANDAIDYLCENPLRFQIDYGGNRGNIHAAPYWNTRELLQAVTPYCSSDRLLKLTNLLFDYYPENEYVTQNCLILRGYAQFILLDAIDCDRRTVKVQNRLEEWKRKFISIEFLDRSGKIEPPTPKPMMADLVGSPIPQEAGEKMTDEQWLKAIAKYNQDDPFGTWFKRDDRLDRLVGNSRELASQVLKPQAEQAPMRFAKLLLQFSEETKAVYFNDILWGISETDRDLDLDIVVNVLKYCHDLPQKPCGRYISWVLRKHSYLPWPTEIFDIIIWYTLNDPDPERESWRTEASHSQVYYGGDPEFAGINSVRGNTVGAIANLIFSDSKRAEYFIPTLRRVVSDRSIAVRTCVAESLVALLNFDRDLAVSLFQQLCETEDILLGTHGIERFLKYAKYTHFESLKLILTRMTFVDEKLILLGLIVLYFYKFSVSANATFLIRFICYKAKYFFDVTSMIEAGSRQICVLSLDEEKARCLVHECLNRTSIHRKAIAGVCVANLRSPDYRQSCEDFLIQLVNDPDKKVYTEVARCFYFFEDRELGNYTNLVENFVRSRAFEIDSEPLVRALQKTTAELPDITYEVCDRYVQNILASTETNIGISSENVSQLLIRVYSQKKALQSKCLDLIDSLAKISAYGLEKNLADYER